MDEGPRLISFDDGEAYESFMGRWSRPVGDAFLDWIAPPPGWRWLDVGCGNGVFTEALLQRCAPAEVQGVDPSPAQIAFASTRPGAAGARFACADAMALPCADDRFDAAVMALVIFFVPEPARGVAEMVRVVRPGGTVCAYAWDMPGGGFPHAPLREAFAAIGTTMAQAPHPEVSSIDALAALWADAGLVEVATREFSVQRRFDGFADYWRSLLDGPGIVQALRRLDADTVEALQGHLRARLPAPDAQGRLTLHARANAVSGRVAG